MSAFDVMPAPLSAEALQSVAGPCAEIAQLLSPENQRAVRQAEQDATERRIRRQRQHDAKRARAALSALSLL